MINITITDKKTERVTMDHECDLVIGCAIKFDPVNDENGERKAMEEYGASCGSFFNGSTPVSPMILGDPIGTGLVRVIHDACANVGEEVVLLGRIKDIVTEAHRKAAKEMGAVYTGRVDGSES